MTTEMVGSDICSAGFCCEDIDLLLLLQIKPYHDRIRKKPTDSLRNLYETAFYFAVMAVKENFRNYVGRAGTVGAPKPSVLILGNGPSLAEDLPRLIARGEHTAKGRHGGQLLCAGRAFRDRPSRLLRAFRSDVLPRQCLPRPCGGTLPHACRKGDVADEPLRAVLQPRAVRLPCRAAQPQYPHRAGSTRRSTAGSGAWSSGSTATVWEACQFRDRGAGVQYVALLLGYKTLELYGVDHTLLDGLSVDDENRLCRADRHYYDDAPAVPKPIFQKVPHRPYTMAVYLAEVAELFRGHEALRDYARSLGARIINRTGGR